MDLSTTNHLILEHLRFYGYQLAARIVESEFKGKQPKEQSATSRLFEILQKFVELYGKPDLWNNKSETPNQEELDTMKINLPRMNNSPFRGVQSNKNDGYPGPFQKGHRTQEPYRVAYSSSRTDPEGSLQNKMSLRPPIMGNTAPVAGHPASSGLNKPNNVKDHSSASSHMAFIANALRNKDAAASSNNDKNAPGIMRTASHLQKANNVSRDSDSQYVESQPDFNSTGEFRAESLPSAKKPLQNFRAYQTDSKNPRRPPTSYLETAPNEPENSRRNWNDENFSRTKPGRSASVQPIEQTKGKINYNPKRPENSRHESFVVEDSQSSSFHGDQSFLSAVDSNENYFGRTRNFAPWQPQKNKENNGHGTSLLQDYNSFLQQKSNNNKPSFQKPPTANPENIPPTFRIEPKRQQPENTMAMMINSTSSQQQPFQKDAVINLNHSNQFQKNPSFLERKFEKKLSIIEERNSDQYFVLEAIEAEKKKQTASPDVNKNTIQYLKENTIFSEVEIRRLFGEYNQICEMPTTDPYLEKNKFDEFIKRTKNIGSSSFVNCLFTFGSQMGILNGNPPRIGFEESLIVLSQLTQKNPIDLMRFLFMIGSGGRREIQLAVLEQILKELFASENKETIKLLFKCIEYFYNNSRIHKEEMVSLDTFWDIAKNSEAIQPYF